VDIAPYIGQLKDKDYKNRIKAADALGDIGDEKAVKHLIPLLKDENEYVRQAGARALGKLKDRDAVEPLINTLNDPDVSVRAFSVWALGKINDSKAVEPMLSLLFDKEEKIRNNSFDALRKFQDPHVKKLMVNTLIKGAKSEMHAEGMLWKLISLEGEDIILDAVKDPDGDTAKTIRNYIKLMGSKPQNVSDIARKTLKEYNDRTLVISELSAYIKSEESPYMSIALLGEFKDPRSLPILLDVVRNKNSPIKASAINAIGNLGDKEAVPVLLDVLSDPKEYTGTRNAAARALGTLGDQKAVDSLINILKNKSEDKDVRIGTAVALGSIRDKRAGDYKLIRTI